MFRQKEHEMNSVAVPIIAIICCTVVAIVWLSINASAKLKKSPSADNQINKRLEELEDHVKNRLETRIANLESLLTDREYQLSEKFKKL